MKLSRRLLLLIVLCLLPMVAAGIATLAGLYAQRRGELDTLATRQAELANADVRGVVDGARTLLLAVAQIQEGPGCPERFASLQRDLSSYRFLMLLDSGGRVICASRPDLAGLVAGRPDWLTRLLAGPARGSDVAGGISAGTYATLPTLPGAFLPLAIRPRASAGEIGC